MSRSTLLLSTYLVVFSVVACARSTAPIPIIWSSKSFGPDGPWSAVEVTIGSNAQTLNLYPGGDLNCNILSTSVCIPGTMCPAMTAGSVFNSSESTSFSDPDAIRAFEDFTHGVLNITTIDKATISSDTINISSSVSIKNVAISVWDDLSANLPDGTQYPIEVGTLSLGAFPNAVNLSIGSSNTGTMIPGTLWFENTIPSNTWSLHIGSVEPPVTPSLVLGGFDQTHVLSPISTQSGGTTAIDLLDIELNVIEGASPFKANFTSLSGLLATNNASITDITVQVDPLSPYITLPQSVCDAIAAQLPVTYQSKYGLYFWNTADPLYQTIVSSASALTFIFRKDESNTQNITINVPFLLLNLTLTEPIISPDTPYFPCKAVTPTGSYRLGRAFLQAAFIGANWNTNMWWLAQAPGPNVADISIIIPMSQNDTNITPSSNSWNISWSRNWIVLDDSPSGTPTEILTSSLPASTATNTPTFSSSSSSSGISTGAKTGIGAGIGAVALVGIIAIGMYFVKRNRDRTIRNGSVNGSAMPMIPVNGESGMGSLNGVVVYKPELGAGEVVRMAELGN